MTETAILKISDYKNRILWGVLCMVGILLTACAPATPEQNAQPPVSMNERLPHAVSQNPPGGVLMLSSNTKAGDALGNILLPRMGSTGGVLVTSLVNLEDLDKTCAFGRLTTQQIGSRLSQHGFKVLEPRLSSTLRFENREGEFMLTRESMRLLSTEYDAHAVMVGTYSESKDRVFLSVRVVRLNDSAVMAAYEYFLPKNDDVQALMGVGRGGHDNALWFKYAKRDQAF